MDSKKQKLYSYLLEQMLSEDIWSDKVSKLVDSEGIGEDIAKYYVNKFKEFKNKLNVKSFQEAVDILNISLVKSKTPNDINAYESFKDLESVVDYLESVSAKRSADTRLDIEVDGGKEIYKSNDLVIWLARNRKACIEYSTGYSWCVGRQDSSNMYYSYRFKDHEPTFYFVKDVEKTKNESFFSKLKGAVTGDFKDKYHFFVIQVPKNGESRDVYIVTSAKNDGDKQMTWTEIESICPALKGKRDLFKHVPIEGAEKEVKDKFYDKDIPGAEEFKKMSYEDKEWYLDIRVKELEDLPNELFFLLPDELKKKFIGYGVGLTKEMLDYINKKSDLLKYKRKVGEVLLDKLSKNEISLKIEQYSYFDETHDLSELHGWYIRDILIKSPIADKILDSGKLDLSKLDDIEIYRILIKSPIADKILDTGKLDLSKLSGEYIGKILIESPLAEKIWDSEKLDLKKLRGDDIRGILSHSPISEKIWDSGKLDLDELGSMDVVYILSHSPISEKIWDSGKLDVSYLFRTLVRDILIRSRIAEKIWDSDKLDLSKLNNLDIYNILNSSPIAEKIWDSGKLKLSILDKEDYKNFSEKFGTDPLDMLNETVIQNLLRKNINTLF